MRRLERHWLREILYQSYLREKIIQHHPHIVRRLEQHWLREILYQSYLGEKSFSITHKRCQWLREILYQSYLGEKSFSITHKRCQWLREILYQSSYLGEKSLSITHKRWEDLSATDWEKYCINPTSERNHSASPTHSEKTWAALTERNIVSILPQREIIQHHPHIVRRLERHWLREILYQSYLGEKSFSITHKRCQWLREILYQSYLGEKSFSITHKRCQWLREILYQSSYLGEKSFSITHKRWEDLSATDWEKYCINPTSERNHSASPTHSEKTWAPLTERNIVSILPQREIFCHHPQMVRRLERHWLREILYQSYLREKSFSITHT